MSALSPRQSVECWVSCAGIMYKQPASADGYEIMSTISKVVEVARVKANLYVSRDVPSSFCKQGTQLKVVAYNHDLIAVEIPPGIKSYRSNKYLFAKRQDVCAVGTVEKTRKKLEREQKEARSSSSREETGNEEYQKDMQKLSELESEGSILNARTPNAAFLEEDLERSRACIQGGIDEIRKKWKYR